MYKLPGQTDSAGNDIYYYVIPTENHIDLNTGGAAPGYLGKYVTAAKGGGQTLLGDTYSSWNYGGDTNDCNSTGTSGTGCTGGPTPTGGYNAEDALDANGQQVTTTDGRLVDATDESQRAD